MHQLLEMWFGWVLNWGYLGIIVLMAMESSIFPVPSEVVIPPAAFLAAQGHLDFTGVVLAGTLGSYLGSAITYWVARALGPPDYHALREILPHRAGETGTRRGLAGALRSGRDFLCASAPGDPASDLDPSRHRADEFHRLQHRHDNRLGHLVLHPCVAGRQGIPGAARSDLKSGRDGGIHQVAVDLDCAPDCGVCRPLSGGHAADARRAA